MSFLDMIKNGNFKLNKVVIDPLKPKPPIRQPQNQDVNALSLPDLQLALLQIRSQVVSSSSSSSSESSSSSVWDD